MKLLRSKSIEPAKMSIKATVLLFSSIAASLMGHMEMSQAEKPQNVLAVQNDSGQFALVKTVGPTKAIAKIPLDQKKTILLTPGDYYILIRFGYAPKEHIYTKSDSFSVTQGDNQFSYTTITLHRIVAGMKNSHEVSGEEFKKFRISKRKMRR